MLAFSHNGLRMPLWAVLINANSLADARRKKIKIKAKKHICLCRHSKNNRLINIMNPEKIDFKAVAMPKHYEIENDI